MATLVVFPSNDGYARHTIGGEDWATIRGSAGTANNNGAGSFLVDLQHTDSFPTDAYDQLTRILLTLDTSALTGAATVSAATFSVWHTVKQNQSGNSLGIGVYGSTQTGATIVSADFNKCGSTLYAPAIAYGSLVAAAYNDFAFNSTGLSAINLTGSTRLSMRESVHDGANVAPTWVSLAYDNIQFSSVDSSGTTQDPKLTVTYTGGAEAHSGTIAITGSGVYNGAAQKGTSAAIGVLTGSGVYSRAVIKGGQSGSVLTGGGVYSRAATKSASAARVLTGGGVYSRAAQKGALLAPIVTGGGVYSRAATKGTSAIRVLTGGGVYNRAATKSTSAIRVLTGGGVVLINGAKTSGETHFGVIAITGGGVYSRAARKGALLLPVVTGGGIYNRAATKSAPLLLVVTGGGVYMHGHIPLTPPVIQPVVGDGQMSNGRGRRTPFDDWTLPMDDEAVIEIYLLGKTR